MVTPELLRFMFQYNAWADRRMLDACAALTTNNSRADLGSSFSSVRDTVVHFTARNGFGTSDSRAARRRRSFPRAGFPDLASIRAKLEEMDRYFIDYVSKKSHSRIWIV